MFGSLGGPEILFVFVLALLLFGPRQLPKLGRMFGRTLSEFRKASHDFRNSLEKEIEVEEMKKAGEDLKSIAREADGAARDMTAAARGLRDDAVEAVGLTDERKAAGPSRTSSDEAPNASMDDGGTRSKP